MIVCGRPADIGASHGSDKFTARRTNRLGATRAGEGSQGSRKQVAQRLSDFFTPLDPMKGGSGGGSRVPDGSSGAMLEVDVCRKRPARQGSLNGRGKNLASGCVIRDYHAGQV